MTRVNRQLNMCIENYELLKTIDFVNHRNVTYSHCKYLRESSLLFTAGVAVMN